MKENTIDENIIRLNRVSKTYANGVKAIEDVSVDIKKNEVVVIVGPSGSGKSTLLRCINGLEDIDDGSIHIDSSDLEVIKNDRKKISEKIGMVFQSYNLFPHMTVQENINLAQVHVRKINKIDSTKNTMNLLKKVGIDEKADCYPHELSGGQQQRVAIARALAIRPEVMLFDEVTSALDTEMVGEVVKVMKHLADDGMTMVVVTHELDFARKAGTRIIFMDNGKIVEDREKTEFFNNPQHERTKKFLSQILH